MEKHKRGADLHQLTLNYRTSPLSTELRPTPGPVTAGDRAPDAPCRDAEGRATSLFQLFRGPHWTKLIADARHYSVGRPDEPATTIIDTDRHIKAACDLTPGTILLIRPDGYVGLCTESPADVASYLRRVTT